MSRERKLKTSYINLRQGCVAGTVMKPALAHPVYLSEQSTHQRSGGKEVKEGEPWPTGQGVTQPVTPTTAWTDVVRYTR